MKFFHTLRSSIIFFLVGISLCRNIFNMKNQNYDIRKYLFFFLIVASLARLFFSAVFSVQDFFFLEIAQQRSKNNSPSLPFAL